MKPIKRLLLTVIVAFSISELDAQVLATVNLPASVSAGEEFIVSIDINKSGVDGFAKLEHQLPPGFGAKEGKLAGGTFKFKDGKVKYIWMALPGGDSFTVSYLLTAAAEMSGQQILEGAFSYVKDDVPVKYQLPKALVLVSAGTSASEVATTIYTEEETNSSYTETQAPETATTYYEPEQTIQQSQTVEQLDAVAALPEISDASTEITGLVYRVQVMAGYDLRDASAIASNYGISEQVTITEHEGMYKYVVGGFNRYRAAKTLSNELRNNTDLPGPFVVAYRDGYRITTAEALKLLKDNLRELEQTIRTKTTRIGQ